MRIIRKIFFKKNLKAILVLFVLSAAIFLLDFFVTGEEAQAGYPWNQNLGTYNGNCYREFSWRDFNTAIKSDGTRNLYLTDNSEGAIIVHFVRVAYSTTAWNEFPIVWDRGGGDPLTSGVGVFTILASNAYWFGGDIDTGEVAGWKCPSGGFFSVGLWASGTRNSPDEPNLAPPGANGFPYGANIGVNTGSVNLNNPTQPILSWNSWNSAQERWHVQVDNNSDFSSPEWNSGDQPGANTSIQTGVLPANQTFYWRVAVCGDTKNKVVAGPQPWTTSGEQLCAWTPWANSDGPFTTALPTYTLTVSNSATDSGTVTSNPAGIDCGTTCSASYTSFTSVTLTASAASGSTFTGWSGDCSGTGSCTLTMNSNKSVTATFDCTLPTAPSLVSPANGSNLGSAPQTPTFQWSDSTGETGYYVDLCTDSNCNGYTNKGPLSAGTTQTTWNSSLSAGTYWWRVYAYNSCGGIHSAIWSFTVSSPPVNQAPVAVATISKDGSNYADSITVTQGVATPIYLSASDSSDPNGWTDPTNGVSSGGKCEWNRDLNQGAPTFEPPVINNPASPSACNISLGNLTFNDSPGTYTYQVLRITDKPSAVSNIDTVSVTVQLPPNQAPSVTPGISAGLPGGPQPAVSQPDYCSVFWPAAAFAWTFSDPDPGDTQSAYQIQIDNESSFTPPYSVDYYCALSQPCTGDSNSYATLPGDLAWDTTYYWQVKVWDNYDAESNWAAGSSFQTPVHDSPSPDFTVYPQSPAIDEIVFFIDDSKCYSSLGEYDCSSGGASISYFWEFGDGQTSTKKGNASTTYDTIGAKTAKLTITDDSLSPAASCETTRPINVTLPLPYWREIPPF